jgi:hypothetical protein
MAVTIESFHGVDPNHVAALRTAGIENTDDLMKIWSDKEKRAGLVASTGVPEEQFMKFAGMSRLSRVKGMEMQHLPILVAAGIDGPKRLFGYTPETLRNHLNAAVAEKKLTDPVPSLEVVKAWFASPKPEPRANTHADADPAGVVVK